jgi:hypothetical protein
MARGILTNKGPLSGAGGGLVSLWQEGSEQLRLLQAQSISEQPVNCLDWNRDKPGSRELVTSRPSTLVVYMLKKNIDRKRNYTCCSLLYLKFRFNQNQDCLFANLFWLALKLVLDPVSFVARRN